MFANLDTNMLVQLLAAGHSFVDLPLCAHRNPLSVVVCSEGIGLFVNLALSVDYTMKLCFGDLDEVLR